MAPYNVKDYGAAGDGTKLDKDAIQQALDAAADAGGGDVYIPEGVYIVTGGKSEKDKDDGALRIRSNVHIHGDGMGKTIIKLADGYNGDVTGMLRTPYGETTNNVSVSGLTLDGNRANNPKGKVDGWFNGFAPGKEGRNTGITLDGVETKNMSGYGFDPHEQTYDLTIRNCHSHHNGLDGFTLDYIRGNSVVENNIAYENDRHGFNVVTSSSGIQLLNNIGRNNGSAGLVVQRGSENIPPVTNTVVIGGEYYGNSKEGVLWKMSEGGGIGLAKIHDNGGNGVRIQGSSNVTVDSNQIYNNSQSKPGGYAEVRVEDYDDTLVSGRIFSANANVIRANTISSNRATRGIEEKQGNVDFNLIHDNNISGIKTPIVKIGANSKVNVPNVAGTYWNDNLQGTNAVDLAYLNLGDDSVQLGGGDDTAYGSLGRDYLSLDGGNDIGFGGQDDDTLDGGAKGDILSGGTGKNTFKFSQRSDSTISDGQYDIITDFKPNIDKLDLSALGITADKVDFSAYYDQEKNLTFVKENRTNFGFALSGDLTASLSANDAIFSPKNIPNTLSGKMAAKTR